MSRLVECAASSQEVPDSIPDFAISFSTDYALLKAPYTSQIYRQARPSDYMTIELLQIDGRWCVHTLVRSTVRLNRLCDCVISFSIGEPRPCQTDLIRATHAVVTFKKMEREEKFELKCITTSILYFSAWKLDAEFNLVVRLVKFIKFLLTALLVIDN